MKKIFIISLAFISLLNFQTNAQDERSQTAITTAVPFLLIAADARAAGLADQGVATTPDAFSQQWNPSKYAFISKQQGVGINYTPYLSSLVNDIGLGNLTYYNRFSERSAVAASFKYFSLGEIEFRQNANDLGLIQKPNELTFDVSYVTQLSPTFSMGVTGRYLRSDLKLDQVSEAEAASSFGVDVSAYYQSEEVAYNSFNGRWRAGLNISNIGPKLKYDDAGQEDFIPTTFRLGAGFDFLLDEYNRITPSIEFAKLLVPSPQDFDGDGDIDASDNAEYQEISSFGAIFSSWGDADGGFSEELKEFTWSLGGEYVYRDVFAFRAGYFNEAEEKGARKFVSLGAGFKYTIVNIDISYLFSTSAVRSPLEGTLRFGLSFNFGEDYYDR
ncbi:type IX secretion system outer membrane channel protein PorV [uncultured Aquimarina sp.]|uniref:type IX secretion system outer membrane channel protein PorV n=1 Tax=uncultured Aquimarina sp. TaxID=575652 RepID=UPI002606A098|nr:type IX secretion system outer membrane channel protein PorV [uncultured Aquimarina sp.]